MFWFQFILIFKFCKIIACINEEIKENDFNLNIPRYVDTFEEETPIDMVALGKEMKSINEEEAKLEKEIYDMLLQLECQNDDKDWLNGVLEVFNYGK